MIIWIGNEAVFFDISDEFDRILYVILGWILTLLAYTFSYLRLAHS